MSYTTLYPFIGASALVALGMVCIWLTPAYSYTTFPVYNHQTSTVVVATTGKKASTSTTTTQAVKKPKAQVSTLTAIPLGKFIQTADRMTAFSSKILSINKPTIRATVKGNTVQHAKVVFTYLGHTKDTLALADGELRRQMAIKMLSKDLCNMLIVSWQFEPNARLQVLKKYNPGQTDFDSCGADGYTVLKPSSSARVPTVKANSTHTLEAEITSAKILVVKIDGGTVWKGSVAEELKQLKGPVGLRTDNAAFKLTFYAPTR